MSTLAPASLLSSLSKLATAQQAAILDDLSDEDAEALLHDWPAWARANQLPPEGAWQIWLVLAGRGFGKTRIGAEWTRAQVQEFEHVNLIGPSAADVRDVMIEGVSGVLAVCPPWERPEYLASRRLLRWPNGARSLLFSAEDPEQLRGPQHQRLWCDEIAAWANHTREETWDLAVLGLRLGPDPRALLTTTPKPVPLLRELVSDPNVTITKGSTYENRANLAPTFFSHLIRKYEGTRMGRQELEAELLLDEGLAYRLIDGVHVVPFFTCPEWWQRFEGFDHGRTHAAAWLSFATDNEGNTIAQHGYYSPGLVSEHAEAIKAQRVIAGEGLCFADPSIKNRTGIKDWKGTEVSVELEYIEHGLSFAPGQNDRRAGHLRLAELLNVDPEREFPDWHPLRGELGAPRLFIQDREELQPLIEQLRDAPLEDPDSPLSKLPGEAVEQEWESRSGHAHAAARYGLMSRASASPVPGHVPDPRVRSLRDQWKKDRSEHGYEL